MKPYENILTLWNHVMKFLPLSLNDLRNADGLEPRQDH